MPNRTFDDDQNLIQLLLLESGRLMEDAAPDFALAWPKYRAEQITRIERLQQLAADLASLAGAAKALHRREAD